MRPCDIMAHFGPELVAFTLSSNPFIPGEVFECYLLACAVILYLVSCDRVPNAADVRICFFVREFRRVSHDTVPMESSIYSIAYIEGSDPVRLSCTSSNV